MKQNKYQPRAYMQMLKREGKFRILKSSLSKDIRIWHNCDEYRDEDLEKNHTIFEVRYWSYNTGYAWKCSQCHKDPPEGLLGAYIMLDWKRATDEVADAAMGHDRDWTKVTDLPF